MWTAASVGDAARYPAPPGRRRTRTSCRLGRLAGPVLRSRSSVLFDRIVAFSLRQRVLVLFATVGLVAAGLYAATRLPVDAVPDVTNNQVQVLTQAPALSPLEVERFVTVPVELALKSLPDLVELRSLSRQGISVITVVFEEGVDTYFGRQLILEQLRGIESELPPGTETPSYIENSGSRARCTPGCCRNGPR